MSDVVDNILGKPYCPQCGVKAKKDGYTKLEHIPLYKCPKCEGLFIK